MASYMQYTLRTEKEGFYDITHQVTQAVADSNAASGVCVVYCPHTTAGITVNEDADPDVRRDLLLALGEISPDRPAFRHMEGNSAAHVKASLTGPSVTLIVEEGKPLLGTWQGVYFCEFDGPRTRKYYVKVVGDQ